MCVPLVQAAILVVIASRTPSAFYGTHFTMPQDDLVFCWPGTRRGSDEANKRGAGMFMAGEFNFIKQGVHELGRFKFNISSGTKM